MTIRRLFLSGRPTLGVLAGSGDENVVERMTVVLVPMIEAEQA